MLSTQYSCKQQSLKLGDCVEHTDRGQLTKC